MDIYKENLTNLCQKHVIRIGVAGKKWYNAVSNVHTEKYFFASMRVI